MINVSSAWHRALLNDNRAYKEYITITLTDNTVLNLTEANIWQGGFQIEDAVSDESSFQLGAAIVNKLSLTINNIYDTYSEYVFDDAHVDVSIGLVTDTNTEIIDKGKFIVNTATYNGSLIHLECYDYMTKFDKPYSQSQLVYPATLDEIVRDACTNCGLTLGTLNFPHKSFEIAARPDGAQITFREVISWCAQIAGCFARMSVEGKLELKWYDQSALENLMDGADGGAFDTSTPYSTGDSVNGGTFNPWNTGDVLDGGALSDSSGVHLISSIYSRDISVDDVVITGVSIEIKTEDNGNPVVTHLGGTSGYVVAISDNPLITTTNYSSILTWLQNQLVGFKFRKASISHGSDPSIEAGDVAMVFDTNGNQYPIVVSKTTFSVGSSQNTVSAAQTPARNSAARYSAETKNYVELRKKVEAEKGAREIAEAAIREELAAGNGLYYTAVPDTQDPTSTIYCLHNKTLLADSAIRIEFSTAGISVTADGTSQTPSRYGLTVNGDMLLNLLSATGILADWIHAGTLTLGGVNNENGVLRVVDSSGNRFAYLDVTGFYLGNIASNLTNPNFSVTPSGNVNAKSLTANNYVYINGNNQSFFKIPLYSTNARYIQLDQTGFVVDNGTNTINIPTNNSNYKGLYLKSNTDTNFSDALDISPRHLFIYTSGGDDQLSLYGDEIGLTYKNGSTRYYLLRVRTSNKWLEIGSNDASTDVYGSFIAHGTKSRVVETDDYANRLLYCYETPSPFFGDIGEGVIGDDGKCYVTIDPIFAETVNLDQYQVFLQQYGLGNCYVSERKGSYFVVEGEPGLSFGWEIKAKQSNFSQLRLTRREDVFNIGNQIDYIQDALDHIKQISREREIT